MLGARMAGSGRTDGTEATFVLSHIRLISLVGRISPIRSRAARTVYTMPFSDSAVFSPGSWLLVVPSFSPDPSSKAHPP